MGRDLEDTLSECETPGNETDADTSRAVFLKTPLERIVAPPETIAAEELTANQERARFVAKDVTDYARKVPTDFMIDSSSLRRVLAAKENGGVHTETVSRVMEFLNEFGNVTVKRITEDFRHEVMPSRAEWQELLSSIPPRQSEFLNAAAERGYFEIPRQITLEELADEMDITKTTASNHLRKAERKLIQFLLPYINLAAKAE